MKSPTLIPIHNLSAEATASELKSNLTTGLTEKEALKRLARFGKNSLTEDKKSNYFALFFKQFNSPIVFLLLGAVILSFWFKEWLDGIAILTVTIINSIIGFYMEYQASQSMQALKQLSVITTKVLRKGRLKEINSEQIVPGDIVYAEAGDLVPADGRIFSLSQLQSDESALTGESLPVEKDITTLPASTPLADRTNMLYKGTFISKGNGYIIITATGMNTELGKVASLVQSADKSATPLEKKLETFSKKLIKVTIALILIIFITGLINGREIIEMLATSVALAVAAIPEGLPIVATIALAKGMIKLARHKVIIKKLSAVETLGGTNIICSDKTGTLTKNKIEVTDLFPTSEDAIKTIKKISILCNTAELYEEDGLLKELGDPLETGLLKYFSREAGEISRIRNKYAKLGEEPFSSETKIMATLHKSEKGFIVYAKGATEEILTRCNRILVHNEEKTLEKEERANWLAKARNHATAGMRMIAVAYKHSSINEKKLSFDLVFCGLIGMVDPPRREEVYTAIKECNSAGIKVLMITGDHPSTAGYIAQQLNITQDKEPSVIIGKDMKDFEYLSEQEKHHWLNSKIFARVSPKQKLDIVKVFQEKNYVVAMTGDGINDAPALKKADIGIAMGMRGTQVAQEAADMIIKDDSFTSIVTAIKQGRVIYENIRKFLIYLLSCNMSELFIISIASVFVLPFQLFPIQILFINLITDVLPALALGVTEGNADTMKFPPRKETEPIIDKKRWWTIFFYSIIISLTSIGAVLWSHYKIHGGNIWDPKLANNILFFTLIFSQLLHVLNMGNSNSGISFFKSEVFRNKYVWISIITGLAVLLTFVFVTPIQQVLTIHPISIPDWSLIVIASLASLFINQMAKKFKIIYQ